MDNELFKQTQLAREQWAMKHYKKHETELGLNELKELDLEYPGWGLATTKKGDVLEVSMGGTRVRDAITRYEYKVSYSLDHRGKPFYPMINFTTPNGKWGSVTMHRMVAQAFVDNPDPANKTDVNHIDGNKWNNAYWNLEWVTKAENTKHAYRTGLIEVKRGEESNASKYTEEQVRQVCQLLKDHPEKTFYNIADIVGVRWTAVRLIYQGNAWTHISKDYQPFPPRQTRARGETVGTSVYTADKIEQVCQLLNDTYLGKTKYIHKEIAVMSGVSKDIVDKIATGDNWTHISSKYDWYKAKFGDQAKQGPANNS